MKRLIGITVILALAIVAGAFYGGRQRIFHSSPIPPQTPATAFVPAPTATSIPAPYGGTLVLNDPLRDNSLGYGWREGSSQGGTCAFTGGAYHVSTPSTNSGYHCRAFPDFSNFAFEVQMVILQGDSGGIDFRLDSAQNTKYEFYVNQDGMYAFLVAQGTTAFKTLVQPTNSSAVHQGLGQTNIIAVVAQGSTITLYANHQLLARVTDSTYSHGRIALDAAANITDGHPTEVVYSNAKVWTL
jgi:eukaryotic-like serine/threonine-protein kinase